MSKQKITLTAIAKQAGLSIASVSRVIHTPHLTRKDTQDKINQAITALNFDPKVILKPYNTHKRYKRLLVIDNQLVTNNLINKGIESKAKESGYKLLYFRFFYFSEQDIQQIISYTINYQLDGILIINDSPYIQSLLRYRASLPPIILVNQFSLDLPCVYFDHLSIAYEATQYFIEQGHEHIAILLGDMNKTCQHHLKNGYIQALTRKNIPISSQYIVSECLDYYTSNKATQSLLELKKKPTAIICCDHLCLNYTDLEQCSDSEQLVGDISAEGSICGVIDFCRKENIVIPDDLSLLQFIHSKNHKHYNPLNHICAIHKPLFEMGARAVTLLISLLSSQHMVRIAQLIESELVIRRSTTKRKSFK